MKKVWLLGLIVFCGFNVFAQTEKAVKTPLAAEKTRAENAASPVTGEEYAVYLAVLGRDGKNFVVRDKTSIVNFNDEGTGSLNEIFKELKPETIKDFRTKNKESSQLEKKFPTKNDYSLITGQELEQFFDKRLDWQGFYKKYPDSGGFSTFSRVGFGKDGTQALVFVAQSCGGLCGEGNYYFLKKENGDWKVVNKMMTWIS